MNKIYDRPVLELHQVEDKKISEDVKKTWLHI